MTIFSKSSFAFLSSAAALTFLATGSTAQAGSSAGTIGVSLNVSAACAVNGASGSAANLGQIGALAFADQPGIFGNTDAALTASGGGNAISVLCTPGLTPTLTIGTGANDSNGVRRMSSGSNNVAYHLYSDSNRSNEITVGQQLSLGTATSSAFSVPIYGRVNSGGQVLPAGAYTDTVQVTLAW